MAVPLAAGAVGGAVIAALAMIGYSAFSSAPALPDAAAARIAALESATQKDAAAVSAVEKRVAAVEAASAALAPKIAAASQGAEQAAAAVKALRAAPAVEGGSAGPAPDLGPFAERIDKLEQALAAQQAAPKGETRVAPEPPTQAVGGPSAIAIVTEAVRDKLTSGVAFPQELAALQSLGVDAARLAPLKAVVDGAPSGAALATAFEAIAPEVLARAVAPSEKDGVADKFLAHLRGLVVVHDLHETPGDDPGALVSQIEAKSRRGDLKGAMDAFAKLPEPARKAAAAWSAQAGQALAAAEALQAIQDDAISRLTAGGKS